MFGSALIKKATLYAATAVMFFSLPAIADNLNVNGANRTMNVYAPKNIEKNRPLIIQMHGMNQDAPYQQNAAKWEPRHVRAHHLENR